MPRNVRNFWIELDVDGRASRVETGPVRKDGGFSINIKMRDKGDVVRAARVWGVVMEDGEGLVLGVDCEAQERLTVETNTYGTGFKVKGVR